MEAYCNSEYDGSPDVSTEEEGEDEEESQEGQYTHSFKKQNLNEKGKSKLSEASDTAPSEDSGLTWETGSSRCSTSQASETSMTSGGYYIMENSYADSPPGKVILHADEGKTIQKRTSKSPERILLSPIQKMSSVSQDCSFSGSQMEVNAPGFDPADPQSWPLQVQPSKIKDYLVQITQEAVPVLSDEKDKENALKKKGELPLKGTVKARIEQITAVLEERNKRIYRNVNRKALPWPPIIKKPSEQPKIFSKQGISVSLRNIEKRDVTEKNDKKEIQHYNLKHVQTNVSKSASYKKNEKMKRSFLPETLNKVSEEKQMPFSLHPKDKARGSFASPEGQGKTEEKKKRPILHPETANIMAGKLSTLILETEKQKMQNYLPVTTGDSTGEAEQKEKVKLEPNLGLHVQKTETIALESEYLGVSHSRDETHNRTAQPESQNTSSSFRVSDVEREFHQYATGIARSESEHPTISEPLKAPQGSEQVEPTHLRGKEVSPAEPFNIMPEQLQCTSSLLTETIEKQEIPLYSLGTETPLSKQLNSVLPYHDEQMETKDNLFSSPETEKVISEVLLPTVGFQTAEATKPEIQSYPPTIAPSEELLSISGASDMAVEKHVNQPSSSLTTKELPSEVSISLQEAAKLENQVHPPTSTKLCSEIQAVSHPTADGQQEGSFNLAQPAQLVLEHSVVPKATKKNIQEKETEETFALHLSDKASKKKMLLDKSTTELSHPGSLHPICVPEKQDSLQSEIEQTTQQLALTVPQMEPDMWQEEMEMNEIQSYLPATPHASSQKMCLTETWQDQDLSAGTAVLNAESLNKPNAKSEDEKKYSEEPEPEPMMKQPNEAVTEGLKTDHVTMPYAKPEEENQGSAEPDPEPMAKQQIPGVTEGLKPDYLKMPYAKSEEEKQRTSEPEPECMMKQPIQDKTEGLKTDHAPMPYAKPEEENQHMTEPEPEPKPTAKPRIPGVSEGLKPDYINIPYAKSEDEKPHMVEPEFGHMTKQPIQAVPYAKSEVEKQHPAEPEPMTKHPIEAVTEGMKPHHLKMPHAKSKEEKQCPAEPDPELVMKQPIPVVAGSLKLDYLMPYAKSEEKKAHVAEPESGHTVQQPIAEESKAGHLKMSCAKSEEEKPHTAEPEPEPVTKQPTHAITEQLKPDYLKMSYARSEEEKRRTAEPEPERMMKPPIQDKTEGLKTDHVTMPYAKPEEENQGPAEPEPEPMAKQQIPGVTEGLKSDYLKMPYADSEEEKQHDAQPESVPISKQPIQAITEGLKPGHVKMPYLISEEEKALTAEPDSGQTMKQSIEGVSEGLKTDHLKMPYAMFEEENQHAAETESGPMRKQLILALTGELKSDYVSMPHAKYEEEKPHTAETETECMMKQPVQAVTEGSKTDHLKMRYSKSEEEKQHTAKPEPEPVTKKPVQDVTEGLKPDYLKMPCAESEEEKQHTAEPEPEPEPVTKKPVQDVTEGSKTDHLKMRYSKSEEEKQHTAKPEPEPVTKKAVQDVTERSKTDHLKMRYSKSEEEKQHTAKPEPEPVTKKPVQDVSEGLKPDYLNMPYAESEEEKQHTAEPEPERMMKQLIQDKTEGLKTDHVTVPYAKPEEDNQHTAQPGPGPEPTAKQRIPGVTEGLKPDYINIPYAKSEDEKPHMVEPEFGHMTKQPIQAIITDGLKTDHPQVAYAKSKEEKQHPAEPEPEPEPEPMTKQPIEAVTEGVKPHHLKIPYAKTKEEKQCPAEPDPEFVMKQPIPAVAGGLKPDYLKMPYAKSEEEKAHIAEPELGHTIQQPIQGITEGSKADHLKMSYVKSEEKQQTAEPEPELVTKQPTHDITEQLKPDYLKMPYAKSEEEKAHMAEPELGHTVQPPIAEESKAGHLKMSCAKSEEEKPHTAEPEPEPVTKQPTHDKTEGLKTDHVTMPYAKFEEEKQHTGGPEPEPEHMMKQPIPSVTEMLKSDYLNMPYANSEEEKQHDAQPESVPISKQPIQAITEGLKPGHVKMPYLISEEEKALTAEPDSGQTMKQSIEDVTEGLKTDHLKMPYDMFEEENQQAAEIESGPMRKLLILALTGELKSDYVSMPHAKYEEEKPHTAETETECMMKQPVQAITEGSKTDHLKMQYSKSEEEKQHTAEPEPEPEPVTKKPVQDVTEGLKLDYLKMPYAESEEEKRRTAKPEPERMMKQPIQDKTEGPKTNHVTVPYAKPEEENQHTAEPEPKPEHMTMQPIPAVIEGLKSDYLTMPHATYEEEKKQHAAEPESGPMTMQPIQGITEGFKPKMPYRISEEEKQHIVEPESGAMTKQSVQAVTKGLESDYLKMLHSVSVSAKSADIPFPVPSTEEGDLKPPLFGVTLQAEYEQPVPLERCKEETDHYIPITPVLGLGYPSVDPELQRSKSLSPDTLNMAAEPIISSFLSDKTRDQEMPRESKISPMASSEKTLFISPHLNDVSEKVESKFFVPETSKIVPEESPTPSITAVLLDEVREQASSSSIATPNVTKESKDNQDGFVSKMIKEILSPSSDISAELLSKETTSLFADDEGDKQERSRSLWTGKSKHLVAEKAHVEDDKSPLLVTSQSERRNQDLKPRFPVTEQEDLTAFNSSEEIRREDIPLSPSFTVQSGPMNQEWLSLEVEHSKVQDSKVPVSLQSPILQQESKHLDLQKSVKETEEEIIQPFLSATVQVFPQLAGTSGTLENHHYLPKMPEVDSGGCMLSKSTEEAKKQEIQPLWPASAQTEDKQSVLSAKEGRKVQYYPPIPASQDWGHLSLPCSTETQFCSSDPQQEASEKSPSISPLFSENLEKQEVHSQSPEISTSSVLGLSTSALPDLTEKDEKQNIQSYPPEMAKVMLEEPSSIVAFLLSEAKEMQTSFPLTTEKENLDIRPPLEEDGLLTESLRRGLTDPPETHVANEILPSLTHFDSEELSNKPQAAVTGQDGRENFPNGSTIHNLILNEPSNAMLPEPLNDTHIHNLNSPKRLTDMETIVDKGIPLSVEDISEAEEIKSLPRAQRILKESENCLQKEKEFNEKSKKESIFAPDQRKDTSSISEGYELVDIQPSLIPSADKEDKHIPAKLQHLETVSSLEKPPFHDAQRIINEQEVCKQSINISESIKPDNYEWIKEDGLKKLVKEGSVEGYVDAEQDISSIPENKDAGILKATNVDYFEKYNLVDDGSFNQTEKEQSVQEMQRESHVTKENSETATSLLSSSENILEFSLLETDMDEIFHGTIATHVDTSKVLNKDALIGADRKEDKNRETELTLVGAFQSPPLIPFSDNTINSTLDGPPAAASLPDEFGEAAIGEAKSDTCKWSPGEENKHDVLLHGRCLIPDDGTGMYLENDIPKDGIPNNLEKLQEEQVLKDQPINEQTFNHGKISQGVFDSNLKSEKDHESVHILAYAHEEVLSPRGTVEGRNDILNVESVEIISDIEVAACQTTHAIPFGRRFYSSGTNNDVSSQSREDDLLSPESGQLPEETSDEESSPILDFAEMVHQEEVSEQEDIPCLAVIQNEQSEIAEVDEADNSAARKPVEESTKCHDAVHHISTDWQSEGEPEGQSGSVFEPVSQEMSWLELEESLPCRDTEDQTSENKVGENLAGDQAEHNNREIENQKLSAAETKFDQLFMEMDYSLLSHDFDTYPLYSIKEEEYSDDEDLAELMDYEMVSRDDVFQEETSSEVAHEELLFDDRRSLDHISDSYELVNEREAANAYAQEEEFELMGDESLPPNIPEGEVLQKEMEQAQLEAYCYQCKCPISTDDKLLGEHKEHNVTNLDTAVTELKGQLDGFLDTLQERSLKIEGFVSEIEALFNSLEENCKEKEQLLEEQKENIIKTVVEHHDKKSQSFEEIKSMKMEYLYEQMVNFQEYIDTAKETLETVIKETEEMDDFVFLQSSEEINKRLLSAVENILSLEKMPDAFSHFEHSTVGAASGDQALKHMPVPQTPKLKAQEPNSSTSTSIAVYWTVSEDDVIDFFQVYCMEEYPGSKEPSGLVEEYRVTVKESNCILEDLEPGHCYTVWVMAVNYTGCSFPSDKSTFITAPPSPVITAEDCTVCWDHATIRWSTDSNSEVTDSFTLEYCRQYSPEGEGLRSLAGIKRPELKVNLEPNTNYFFYVRAVNIFGTSEQSEAALISTKGTRFHIMKETAHPAVQVSPNGTMICLQEEAKRTGNLPLLGELLSARGWHYWETTVIGCSAYRLGICYSTTPRDSDLGQNDTSWCLCCSSKTSLVYKVLHNNKMSDVIVTEQPARIGILLDYKAGRLLFFNAERGQVLFALRQKFTDAAHPAFVLEQPGILNLHTGMELPEFVTHS